MGGAYLVSGYARLRAGELAVVPEQIEIAVRMQTDICIGWADGGSQIESIRATGRHTVPFGPLAPALEGDDPLAWHDVPPLVPPGVRRRRRTDVTAEGAHGLRVEHHFRDSYAGTEAETVMHEYLVDAVFDDGRRLASVDVDARVLPWCECPGATARAPRLVGAGVNEIAARVRADLVGNTTCTHLNSTLRTLADTEALAP